MNQTVRRSNFSLLGHMVRKSCQVGDANPVVSVAIFAHNDSTYICCLIDGVLLLKTKFLNKIVIIED